MNSLSTKTKNQWLLDNGFTSGIQNRLENKDSDLDLQPPEDLHRLLFFFEQSVSKGCVMPSILLTIDEWPLYLGTEMDLMMRLRSSANETRRIIDAQCHTFDKDETNLALEMFVLSIGFHWKSTLYAAGSGLVIHNWEGDYLECYSYPSESFEKFKALADQFGFAQETPD
jgi:hypothetical protein